MVSKNKFILDISSFSDSVIESFGLKIMQGFYKFDVSQGRVYDFKSYAVGKIIRRGFGAWPFHFAAESDKSPWR